MIRDITIDQALIELKRTEKALLALRRTRKQQAGLKVCNRCFLAVLIETKECPMCNEHEFSGHWRIDARQHAAAKRASLDLTRKLADLRAGR